MGKFSKKSATKGESVSAAAKPLKKVKRATEDDLETKVNLKKQKVEVTGTTEALADRLQRIEEKVDLLMEKADLYISSKSQKVDAKKLPVTTALAKIDEVYVKAKAESSSSDDESSSDHATSSSSDEDSDEDEKPAQEKAKADTKSTEKDSTSDESDEEESSGRFGFTGGRFKGGPSGYGGDWPFGGRFSGGRCGGYGHCKLC